MEKIRVLVVDDDRTWHDIYKLICGRDYAMSFAIGVEGALRSIEDRRPDAVATDYWLSDGTAACLVPELKKEGIPYILVSSERLDRPFREKLVSECIDPGCFLDKSRLYNAFRPALEKAMEENRSEAASEDGDEIGSAELVGI